MLRELQRSVGSVIRSFRVVMAASRRVGRTEKLERVGRREEALAIARHGLALLRSAGSVQSHPVFLRPGVQSTHAVLTTQVERLSQALGVTGADYGDLVETVCALRELPDKPGEQPVRLKAEWLPYLERRLAALSDAREKDA